MAVILLSLAMGAQESALAQEPDPGFARDRARELLARPWEYKMISSGRNFPPFRLQGAERRGDFLILMHAGIPLPEAQAVLGWSDSVLTERVEELRSAGLLSIHGGRFRPTAMVLSVGDARRHLPVPERLVTESADLIQSRLPLIMEAYSSLPAFSHFPFESASFLILSDVVLDNWQINAVEAEVLRAERPLRAGSRYYYSIQEAVPWDSTEAFGVYGNQYAQYGSIGIGLYGNRRTTRPHFLALSAEPLAELFGTTVDSVPVFKEALLREMIAAARERRPVNPFFAPGLERLGLVHADGRVAVPILEQSDMQGLTGIAGIVTPELTALLRDWRPVLEQAYQASPYPREVTFEEYFMWWYHLFYTAVTDRLAARGTIRLPENGMTYYVVAS